MSSFGGLILTNRGRNLQSKAQTGVPLQYTRIGIGDGYLGTTPILDLNALRNQVKSLNITKLKNLGNGRAVVGTVLSNQDMVEGFYFRELGVFAQDPDLGEILYCYGNAGNLAEYISPGGGPDIIEKSIDVQTIVGNAQNISAVIDDSLVYATKLDLENIQFPVTSVNSKTGDLTLTAEEIGAETPSGAQAKANAAASAALNAANNYTDQEATETRGIIGLLTNLTTRIKTSIVNAINGLQADFNEHKAEKVHQGEIHGLKLNAEKELEYFDGVEWKASDWKNIDLNTWAGVQKVVRAGQAHKYFQVGDQLVSAYDGGEITWEVIGLDVDTPADSNFAHSMTIQTKDCLHDIQFDAPEPNNPDSNRKSYGSNRYIHSAVRQWLNSNESVFNWQSQHQYDAKPTDSLDLYNGAGFLNRLDPGLASVIGLVNKRVTRNTIVDGGGQDTFTDKVFLLSRVEAGFGTEGDETGEFVYPFYDGIANAGKIKQLNGSNRYWWLRSPYVSTSDRVHTVYTDGSLNFYDACDARGVSPACVII